MRGIRTAAAFFIFLAALFVNSAGADDLPELKFEKYELSNGLDVILHEDHSIPMVSVNVMYHVGSKNEKKGRTGFAHLFEHMMFEGSEHHPEQYSTSIRKYGGIQNGGTREDNTSYWENMPSNFLEKTLWLEADRMGYLLPSVTEERFETQRSIVMNEKRENYDDQPYGKVRATYHRLLYPSDHPYSWIPIGSMDDLRVASLEDIHEFFKANYTPNNASLCIAGDFDPTQAKEWVEKYFGPIPPGPPVDRMEAWVPVLTEEIRGTLEDNVQLPRLYISWHTPPYYAPGDAEFDLFASILAGGKSSRLYKTMVYEKQIAQDVNAYQSSREIGSSFHIVITAKEGHTLEEMETEVNRILDDIRANGVTADEFNRAKINWESGFVRQLQNIGGFGGRAATLNKYNTYLGDPGKLLWDRDRYGKATIEGMMTYVRQYLTPSSQLVLYVKPYGQLAKSETETDMNVEPSPAPDPTFDPPDIQQTKLSNGMELYLVENHKLPLVQVDLLVKSGFASDPADRPGAASLTAELLNEGTKTKSALELSDAFQRLGANFGVMRNFDNSIVTLNVLKKNLDPSLDLVADIVLNPTFPEEELELQKEIYLGRIRQESAQPIPVAYKAFLKELYGENHPYAQPYTGSGTVESINSIERSDIVKFHQAHYLPNNTAAIVVGDITLEEAKKKLEKVFKNWNSSPLDEASVAEVSPPDKTRIYIIDKPGAAQSTIFVGNLIGSRDDPEYVPATVVSNVLGAPSVGRLFSNLRQDKGYTYGAYSFLTGRRGQGSLVCYSQVQTEYTKESIVEFMKELRGITGEIPMSESELNDSKNNMTKGFPQDFQTLDGVANQMATMVTYDLPLDSWETYIGRINSLGVDRAHEIAGEYVHPDALLFVIVGDRAKIEPRIRELGLGEVILSSTE